MAEKSDNIKIILSAISIIVTIILAYIGYSYHYPQDFSLSIQPMQGQVLQQGVIQTTATVSSVNGYDKTVILSSKQAISDIVITFIPSFGDAKPAYNSNILISVGKSIPVGTYEIEIKGQGSDGKTHSVFYTLSVMPVSTPTSEQTLIPIPTPTTPTSVTHTPIIPTPIASPTSMVTPTLTPIPTPTSTLSGIVNIPLSAGWQVDTSETGGVGVEYKNGILELKTKLQGNNVAQFSLDLRGVSIPGIEQNSDSTYNLSGTELIAVVKSNRNFEGRLALFNKAWDFLKGPWLDNIDATNGQMFFKVPNDMNYSKINAISIVFAIQPNETYEGSIFVQSLILKR